MSDDQSLTPSVSVWTERLNRVGSEGWKLAVTAKMEGHEERWAEYRRWSKTPRGRATIALRKIRHLPHHVRYALAALIYPGDLDRDTDPFD